jgi:prepilin-type N-terminal cleavage/methylation domain-containing protein
MINKNFLKNKQSGFTLIETMAAVLLLSIALAGPMTIAQKGLSTALVAKDQNTAFNLAQDAVEYIRFARDTNCLVATAVTPGNCPAGSWLTGTINLGSTGFGCVSADNSAACTVDSSANTGASCVGGFPCTALINFDATNNKFTYSTGAGISPTIFVRTVQIKYNPACTTTCNAAEADITVTVSWSNPTAHSIQVRESLYNWQ